MNNRQAKKVAKKYGRWFESHKYPQAKLFDCGRWSMCPKVQSVVIKEWVTIRDDTTKNVSSPK